MCDGVERLDEIARSLAIGSGANTLGGLWARARSTRFEVTARVGDADHANAFALERALAVIHSVMQADAPEGAGSRYRRDA